MNITEQASIEFKKVLNNFETPGTGIHIFSIQGCCGPSIQMDVANQIAANEIAVNLEGIDFFVDKELLKTLTDVTIDYGANGFLLKGMQKSSGSCCG